MPNIKRAVYFVSMIIVTKAVMPVLKSLKPPCTHAFWLALHAPLYSIHVAVCVFCQ